MLSPSHGPATCGRLRSVQLAHAQQVGKEQRGTRCTSTLHKGIHGDKSHDQANLIGCNLPSYDKALCSAVSLTEKRRDTEISTGSDGHESPIHPPQMRWIKKRSEKENQPYFKNKNNMSINNDQLAHLDYDTSVDGLYSDL